MKMAETIKVYAGGPGSGCVGSNCGRHPSEAGPKYHAALTEHGWHSIPNPTHPVSQYQKEGSPGHSIHINTGKGSARGAWVHKSTREEFGRGKTSGSLREYLEDLDERQADKKSVVDRILHQ